MKYTKTQEKTLDFLDQMESRESLGDERVYYCKCNTCKTSEVIHSAGTVSALFMPKHAGHSTFVTLN